MMEEINRKLEELLGVDVANRYMLNSEEETKRLALKYCVGKDTSMYQALEYKTMCSWLLIAMEEQYGKQR